MDFLPMLKFLGFEINLYAVFILGLMMIFVWLMWKAQRNQRLDWVDIITTNGKNVSLTKILQLVGGVVATWIVVQMTLNSTMTWDVFGIYLAYVASIEGFSKFISAKYGPYGKDDRNGYNYSNRNIGYRNQPPRWNSSKEEIDEFHSRKISGAAKPGEDLE